MLERQWYHCTCMLNALYLKSIVFSIWLDKNGVVPSFLNLCIIWVDPDSKRKTVQVKSVLPWFLCLYPFLQTEFTDGRFVVCMWLAREIQRWELYQRPCKSGAFRFPMWFGCHEKHKICHQTRTKASGFNGDEIFRAGLEHIHQSKFNYRIFLPPTFISLCVLWTGFGEWCPIFFLRSPLNFSRSWVHPYPTSHYCKRWWSAAVEQLSIAVKNRRFEGKWMRTFKNLGHWKNLRQNLKRVKDFVRLVQFAIFRFLFFALFRIFLFPFYLCFSFRVGDYSVVIYILQEGLLESEWIESFEFKSIMLRMYGNTTENGRECKLAKFTTVTTNFSVDELCNKTFG